MSSSWGKSWGKSWGNSWGFVEVEIEDPVEGKKGGSYFINFEPETDEMEQEEIVFLFKIFLTKCL